MRVYIEGYYGVMNLGDDYILLSILNSLVKISSSINQATIASGGDDYRYIFKQYESIGCKVAKSKKEKLYHLVYDDVYILGGGGLFPTENYKNFLKTFLKFAIRKILGKKNIIYGIDIDRISKRSSLIIWKQIAKLTCLFTVRNSYSKELLSSVSTNIKAFTDLTFGLSTRPEEKEDSPNINKLNGREYVVIVVAKPWSNDLLKQQHYKMRYGILCNQLIKLSNRVISDGYVPVFVPFYHINDREFIADIESYLNGDYVVCEENDYEVDKKRMIFAGAKAIISMRFHGIAFSLYNGIPCEAICYAPKAIELMNESGLSNYCTCLGICDDRGFFKEFDIDDKELDNIYDKLFLPDSRVMFQKASKKLKDISQEEETIFINCLMQN